MQNTNERMEMTCPLNGKICKKGIRSDFENKDKECRWWVHLFGKDPQFSDKVIDQWDCAVAWMPTIQTETSQMSRHTTASVDKLANVDNEFKGFIGNLGKALNNLANGIVHVAENQKKMLGQDSPPSLTHDENNEGD